MSTINTDKLKKEGLKIARAILGNVAGAFWTEVEKKVEIAEEICKDGGKREHAVTKMQDWLKARGIQCPRKLLNFAIEVASLGLHEIAETIPQEASE